MIHELPRLMSIGTSQAHIKAMEQVPGILFGYKIKWIDDGTRL